MSVMPTHPTTAIRAYGHSGESIPAHPRIEAASKTNSSDEQNPSSFQSHPDSGHAHDGSHAQGVLRLLQEGHFKGVADVRLRLNFQGRFSQERQDEARSAFQGRLAQVSDQFVSLADALVPVELQTDTAAAAFADALQVFEENTRKALAGRDADDTASYAVVLSDMQAAFDTFSNSVENTFSAALQDFDSSQGGTRTASASSFDLSDFMARLAGIFSDTLEELADQSAVAETRPELSGPSGDGAAYDKFVAEYNRLRNPAETEAAERVNIQA
ncbi:MAG TPA: hypothetical protein VFG50_09815 [Rhodothermales bacterium]|nr:hypothetical protein [Rhodothermales bacterium]